MRNALCDNFDWPTEYGSTWSTWVRAESRFVFVFSAKIADVPLIPRSRFTILPVNRVRNPTGGRTDRAGFPRDQSRTTRGCRLRLYTVKGDNNDSCCKSAPCPEIPSSPKSIENLAADAKESTMECENSVNDTEDTAAATLQEPASITENIDFTVIYNKQKISVNFALDGTVAELKTYLQKIISVPQPMQKVMFKGLAKDDQTLRSLGVTKGAKVMIVGSKLDDVLAVSVPTKQDLVDEAVSSASKEPLSQQKVHRKVLDKGVPEDVMPGILDSKEPLPEFPLAGMLNKSGGKVRLTFKLEQDQLWIGTKERTDKIPMNSIKGVHSEPIHDHPEYHIMAIQLGTTEASRYWIYWVPAQYIAAIKDAILGKWCYF